MLLEEFFKVVNLSCLLAFLILAGKLSGMLALRLGMPRVVGELIAGFVLGISGLGLLNTSYANWVNPSSGFSFDGIKNLRKIAIALFLFIAGTELSFSKLKGNHKKFILIGITSFAFPFLISLCYPWQSAEAKNWLFETRLFIATALSVSALPVLIRFFIDLKVIASSLASLIIAAVTLNDFLSWLTLATFFQTKHELVGAEKLIYLMIFGVALIHIYVEIANLYDQSQKQVKHIAKYFDYFKKIFPVIFMLILMKFNYLDINLAAFVLGLFLSPKVDNEHLLFEPVRKFGNELLAPFFFATVGIGVVVGRDFSWLLTLEIIGLAFLTKFFAAIIAARSIKANKLVTSALSWSLTSRGAMEVLIATLALTWGVIDNRIYVSLIFMAILTTIVSGLMLKRAVERGAFD